MYQLKAVLLIISNDYWTQNQESVRACIMQYMVYIFDAILIYHIYTFFMDICLFYLVFLSWTTLDEI